MGTMGESDWNSHPVHLTEKGLCGKRLGKVWPSTAVEPGYCNRSSSLKVVALKMCTALILDKKNEAYLHVFMFKNKTKSLYVQYLIDIPFHSTTGAQWLKNSLLFASCLHEFSKSSELHCVHTMF